MKQRTFLTIIFVAAFLFLAVGISQLAVTDPVESNYALTARDMARRGAWPSPPPPATPCCVTAWVRTSA